ncbi:MAG: hypothetical protein COU25_03280 [Candidatus Levybacteria bacterium CG10_big_fil_rev_8_21_14_0_10_35_13]|nr:MAG: hypothetical protein COU25_03280 [Candidatus Levybacteria bacterium CG10_big_fil_rev_8_21_14_0_10_35_13]
MVKADIFKNKFVLLGGGILLIVVLFGGLIFFRGSQGQNAGNLDAFPTEIPIPTIIPEELGLSLTEGKPGKTVILTVRNTQGISAIDYELSYTAKDDIPRGAIGSLDLKKKPATKEITLGTCSDVCHYDEDVKDVKILLKVTKEDGNIYSSTAFLETSE